jgi:hypothetical protein
MTAAEMLGCTMTWGLPMTAAGVPDSAMTWGLPMTAAGVPGSTMTSGLPMTAAGVPGSTMTWRILGDLSAMSATTQETKTMTIDFFFTEKVPASIILDGRLAEFGIEEFKNPNVKGQRMLSYGGAPYNSVTLSIDEDGCVKYLKTWSPDNGARIVAALEKALNMKIEVLDLGTFQDNDELTRARRAQFWNHQLSCVKDEDKKAFWMERKEAGFKIDPATAEVLWTYGDGYNPYGLFPYDEECACIGRVYFARSPGTDIWVSFCDLPEATSDALWKKHRRKLAFPAGLRGLDGTSDG